MISYVQEKNNEYFNKAAIEADTFPQAEEMAQRAAEAVVQEFALSTSEDHVKNASVLDFGCGTGLCAFHVVPMVAHLVGVDASEGMLNHLNHKLTTNPSNASIRDKVKTVQHLITYDDPLPESERLQYLTGPDAGFDMIYSSFVMHHIEDLQGTTNTLAQKLLKKDGWLIVLDFSGFHDHGHGHHADDEKHGHHHGPGSKPRDASTYYVDADGKPLEFVPHKAGFTNEGFVEIFKKAGLVDVEAKHSFGMNREWNGKTIWNDVLVVKGRRP